MPIEVESPEEFGYNNILYNLSESSVADINFNQIKLPDIFPLAYTDHKGKPALRKLIAAQMHYQNMDHILLTPGAAPALFIIYTVLLQPSDHIIVIRPNYATNIAVPQAIGCAISYIDLIPEQNWLPTLEAIRKAIQPNTKIISITTPHNPTGMVWPMHLINGCIDLTASKNIYLLADETYRDTGCTTNTPMLASMHPNCISVSSVSKAYGLPGIRMGWLLTQNEQLYEKFLAAKEMIFITNSILDEEACFSFLQEKDKWLSQIVHFAQQNLKLLNDWMANEKRLAWVPPQAGVVCFPWIKESVVIDYDFFYERLLHQYKTMVGPGHWFDMPRNYMRIGYGWTDAATLKQGLENISNCLEDALV